MGGMEQTQQMIDFAGKRGITTDIEVISMDYVNTALECLAKAEADIGSGSTAGPSCVVPVGWVGGHDHEAGTSVPRDLRIESQVDFVVLGRVPRDLAHEDIISGREKEVFELFWPYPSEWRLPGTLADYESPGITMEFLDVINEREKA
ncbi:hypothetical protein GIB67_005626 [Kingdonia uniflora]|uniref:Uncharacterized protein n=1 Tax=Kingdonia uniflora TaxID=39325 RepID=A0A7J7NIB9_9MAGN|nr:hypothetical protein GIB67_005626 [Kingdonia uniflora]